MSTSRFNFTITFIATCLYILLLSSCIKDPYKNGEPSLPPITMEGKNTLGFLLDGKVWVPYQEKPGLFTPTLEAVLDRKSFKITSRLKDSNKTKDEKFHFDLVLEDIGMYEVPFPPIAIYRNYNYEPNNCYGFYNSFTPTIVEIIKFDQVNRVVAGIFTFRNLINECGDTIQITDGRFDVRY